MSQQQHPYNGQPAQSPPLWSPNIFYQLGSVVWYAGSVWRCDQPHTSGSLAREPSESLHLWTPVTSTVPGPGGNGSQSAPFVDFSSRPAPPTSEADRARQAAMREDQDAARNPAALKDECTGAHVWRVGGVGVWAYNEDLEVERTRQGVWKEFTAANEKPSWLKAARARTAAYTAAGNNGGLRPLMRWHLVEGSAPIPNDALIVGQESDGKNLYSARIWHENGLHLGKCGDHLYRRCEYSYGGRTWAPDTEAFEVLCGPPDVVQWIPFDAGTAANQPGWQPVEGGREAGGAAIIVARADHKGSVQPGKIHVDGMDVMIPYGGREVLTRPFHVLAYASYYRR